MTRRPGPAELLLGLPLLAFAFWVALQAPDLTWFNGHMSRDWVRAQEWRHGWAADWSGPELNYNGGRLFGPAFYLWLAALSGCCDGSLVQVLFWHHLLALLPCMALVVALRHDLGRTPAALFFLSYFLMPVHVSVERSLWNPSLVPALNCLVLLALRAAHHQPNRPGPLLALGLLGWLGLQIHLSTIPLWLGGWLWLLLARPRHERRALMAVALALLIYALTFKLLRQEAPAYLDSLRSQYQWRNLSPASLVHYLRRWWGHVHLDSAEIGDFEIYPVMFGYGKFLWPEWLQILTHFQIFGAIWWGLVAVALAWPGGPLPGMYAGLLRWWLGLALLGMWFYNVKDGVLPYRYGLMIYPGQFLLPALAVARTLRRGRWLKPLLGLGAILLFAGNATYLMLSYRVMATAGRASHVAMDAHELPLRYKRLVLSVGMRQGRDPYTYLHGPLVNKLRVHEGERDLNRFYHGVLSSLGPNPELLEGRHLVVRSFTAEELLENAARPLPVDPFHFEELQEEDLPRQVVLRAQNRVIQPAPGSQLLPLQQLGPVSAFSVKAELKRSRPGFLRICYDDSRGYSTLHLNLLRLNGVQRNATPGWAGWLCQSVVTLPLPSGTSRLELGFQVEHPERWGSRLDLFVTPDARPFAPLQSLSPFDQ